MKPMKKQSDNYGIVRLRDCRRTGLFPEHAGIAPITHDDITATLPVIERLLATPGVVIESTTPDGQAVPVRSATAMVGVSPRRYRITIAKHCPEGIVATTIRNSGRIGLRLADEPPYDGEHPSRWSQLDWTPCPHCGAPLVWYEAGFAAGYRVCARSPHHHWQA